jgi:hypothetical protein
MNRAQLLSTQGQALEAQREAEEAFASMQRELPVVQRLFEINPTAAREAQLAFLRYNYSYYEHVVLPSIAGQNIGPENVAAHRRNTRDAAQLLAQALERNQPVAHPGREHITRDQSLRTLASWRRLAESS